MIFRFAARGTGAKPTTPTAATRPQNLAQPTMMATIAGAPGPEVAIGWRPTILGPARLGLEEEQKTRHYQYGPHAKQNRTFPCLPKNHYVPSARLPLP